MNPERELLWSLWVRIGKTVRISGWSGIDVSQRMPKPQHNHTSGSDDMGVYENGHPKIVS